MCYELSLLALTHPPAPPCLTLPHPTGSLWYVSSEYPVTEDVQVPFEELSKVQQGRPSGEGDALHQTLAVEHKEISRAWKHKACCDCTAASLITSGGALFVKVLHKGVHQLGQVPEAADDRLLVKHG